MAYAPVAVIGVILALVPLVIGDSRFYMGLAVGGLTFAAYATGFNIIFGSTGQLFLCLGALAGVAGYGSAILSDQVGLPFVLTVLLGTAVAGLLGGIFSAIAVWRSLGTIFVGIITLTFALGFSNLLLGQRTLTGGETGIVIDAGSGTLLRDEVPSYYVFLIVLVAFLAIYRLIQRSHLGWAFRALRDDPVAASLAGIDVARYKVYAGLIGSTMVGLVGALFAHNEGFVSPTTYGFAHVDVRALVIVALGGIGTLAGPVVGAAIFTVIDEVLRPFSQLRVAAYGVILIALFLGLRHGLVPAVGSVVARLRGRRPARPPGG